MARDRAKNVLRNALQVNLAAGSRTFRDRLDSADRDDLYSIQLGAHSSLELSVGSIGKRAKVNLELFSLKNSRRKTLREIGKTDFSQLNRRTLRQHLSRVLAFKGSKSGERSQSTSLAAGTYFVRASWQRGATPYTLAVAVTPSPSPTDNSVPSPSPNPSPSPTLSTSPSPTVFTRSWVRQFGTAANDYGYGATVRNSKLYVSGSTEGDLSGANVGDRDSFAVQYDTAGNLQWKRQFGTSGTDLAADIAVDAAGNYYVAGVNVSGINPDGYLAKFNSNGVEQWRKTISTKVLNGVFNAGDALSSVAIDNQGFIYVGGLVRGVPSVSASQALITKYDSSGNALWTREFGVSGSSGVYDLAVDGSGNVYATGVTAATLTSNVTEPFISGDAFVVKYDTNGNTLWQPKVLGSTKSDYARGVAVDLQGNIYITGDVQEGGALPGQTSKGGNDGFLAKYNSSGSRLWVKQFGTTALDESQGIAIDSQGNVQLVGETTGALFGHTPLGSSDAWLASFSPNGTRLRSTLIGTAQDDEAYRVTTEGTSVYVIGQTMGALQGNNQGDYDAWVTKWS